MRTFLLHPALAALALASASPAAALDKAPLSPLARVWYVDNTAGPDGDGSMVAPFDRLARAERAADVGDTIYVFHGDGTTKGLDDGIRLRPYQRLVGSGAAFAVDGEAGLPAGESPTLRGRTGPAVILADHALVEGVALSAAAGVALLGDGVSDVRLARLRVDGAVALRNLRDEARLESVDVRAKQSPALTVESSRHGEAVASLDTVLLSTVEAGADDAVLRVVGAGDAKLTLRAAKLVVAPPAGDGIRLYAVGTSVVSADLAVTGLDAAAQSSARYALVADAGEAAAVELTAHESHLLARESGLLLSAHSRGRIRAEVASSTLGGEGAARGVVVLLGDSAEAAVVLEDDRIAGQSGEGVYAVAATSTRLGIAMHDNDLALGTASTAASSFPAVLVETRDDSRACVALVSNRFAASSSGSAPVSLRQRDRSELGLDRSVALAASGTDAAAAVSVESERPLSTAELPCVAAPAKTTAAALTAP